MPTVEQRLEEPILSDARSMIGINSLRETLVCRPGPGWGGRLVLSHEWHAGQLVAASVVVWVEAFVASSHSYGSYRWRTVRQLHLKGVVLMETEGSSPDLLSAMLHAVAANQRWGPVWRSPVD